jgi:hypothetical protein
MVTMVTRTLYKLSVRFVIRTSLPPALLRFPLLGSVLIDCGGPSLQDKELVFLFPSLTSTRYGNCLWLKVSVVVVGGGGAQGRERRLWFALQPFRLIVHPFF